jgi:uncharacterized cupin superfamily protein
MAVIVDALGVQAQTGTIYPDPFRGGLDGRLKRKLTELLGLTQFGVNLTTLEPGARSSQRHWHQTEDEFIYVVSGEVTLVSNDGEQTLGAHMMAAFPAGEPNGHCLINRGTASATYLEIGTRAGNDDVEYPDIDLKGEKRAGAYRFFRKSGEPY